MEPKGETAAGSYAGLFTVVLTGVLLAAYQHVVALHSAIILLPFDLEYRSVPYPDHC